MTVRPNKRRFAIGFYLLTGFTPWGVNLEGQPMADSPDCPPQIPNCGGDWIVCCNHVLKTGEVEQWKRAGLVVDGPVDFAGRPTVIRGPQLARWVSTAWHELLARRWSK